MESRRFDHLTRRLAENASRRGVIGGALAGLVAAVVGAPIAADGAQLAAEGRGKRKRCRGRKRRCGKRCINVKRSNQHCGKCGRRCKKGQRCRNGKCRAQKPPKCGKGGPCRVFITSSEHTGDLNGLNGADTICNTLAQQANLPGSYRAWLSTDAQSPATRFTQNSGRYQLVDGTKIANSWQDLTDGTIQNAITLDENGDPAPAPTRVWTYTLANGQANTGLSCAGWTNGTDGQGQTGFSDDSDSQWTELAAGLVNCFGELPLYCFQQSG